MPTQGPRGSSVDGVPAASVNRKPRVLVVEDSIGVRELQRVILEGAGYDVTTAVDGQDGAGRLGGDPVDLVLSDVEMPGMDGFTLTRTIRKTRGWEDVPVVIMTSRGDDADKRAGLDAGASAYLLKSDFDQAELVDTVRRLVGPLRGRTAMPTVVIADDSPTLRRIVGMVLEREGFTVVPAEDGVRGRAGRASPTSPTA